MSDPNSPQIPPAGKKAVVTIAGGAAAGALIGSFIPVIGTVIGAGLGGIAGGAAVIAGEIRKRNNND